MVSKYILDQDIIYLQACLKSWGAKNQPILSHQLHGYVTHLAHGGDPAPGSPSCSSSSTAAGALFTPHRPKQKCSHGLPRHPNPSNSGEEEDRRDGAAAVYPVAGSEATFYGFIEN